MANVQAPRIGNPFAGAKDSPSLSADHALHKLIDALHAHREALRVWTDPYEKSQPYTIGGPAITGGGLAYSIQCPYDSPAEFTVVQVSFVGTGPFAAALAVNNPQATIPTATSALTDLAGKDYLPYSSNVAANIPQNDNWYPIDGRHMIYWFVGTGGSGQVTVQFRRRVNPAGIYNLSNS